MKVDCCNQTEATKARSGSKLSLRIIRDETQLDLTSEAAQSCSLTKFN